MAGVAEVFALQSGPIKIREVRADGCWRDWSVKMHVGGYMLFYGKTPGDSSEPVVATKLWTSGWLQHADLFPAISPDGVDCLTGFMGVSAVSLEPEPYASVRVVFWKNETRAFVALCIHGKPRTISSLPDRAVDRQVARSGRQVRATVYTAAGNLDAGHES